MHKKAELVQRRLRELGAAGEVHVFPDGTRTAADAAAAIGTTVAQIAKSLVFTADGGPLLVVASGMNRVDPEKVAAVVGAPVTSMDAKTVKQVTGFAVGGVPPVAHSAPLRVIIDSDLLGFPDLWAAAGTPNAVFPTTPDELVRITGGEVADVRQEPRPQA
jgi:prolyl-tRNA editing enzyme YbaK/EbsC (Cys-tRNA(Pro) deacylase)